jgi:hypothetical protein
MTPRISVLVNSFDRLDFVWDALTSVLKQDATEPFEILLTTPHPELEVPPPLRELARVRQREIRTVLVPRGPIGWAWTVAAEVATGRWMALLDDDDLWEPGKIRRVQSALDRATNLVFLHNSQTLVDRANRPLRAFGPYRLVRQSSSLSVEGRELIADPADPLSFAEARKYAPDVNNSSIVIGREIVTGMTDALRQVRRGEDTFVYYAALATGRPFYVTSDRLTRYRIHTEGNTFAPSTAGMKRDPTAGYRDLVAGHRQSLGLLRQKILVNASPWVAESLRNDEAFWAIWGGLAGEPVPSLEERRNLAQLLGGNWLRPRPRDLYAALLGVPAYFAPEAASELFQLWRRLWF